MDNNMLKEALEKLSELKDFNLNDLMPKDVLSNIQMMIASLGQQAFMYLGLQPNPATGQTAKDMAQAKMAIDCISAMADVIIPHVTSREKLELETLKQTLQLNYIQMQ